MSTVSLPNVEATLKPPVSEVTLRLPRTLVVGTPPKSKNADLFGSATAKYMTLSPLSSYERVSDPELEALFGTGQLYHTLRYAKLGVDTNFPIDILLIKNSVAVGTATITTAITGTATRQGFITLSIFNAYEFSATVQVNVGMTATEIATAIQMATTSWVGCSFTVAVVGSSVVFTSVDNYISDSMPYHFIADIPGVTFTTTKVNTGTPTQATSSHLDLLGDTRYTSIILASHLNVGVFNTFLLNRFNVNNNILDGVVYYPITDTYSNLVTNTQNLNGQATSVWADKIIPQPSTSLGSGNKTDPNLRMAYAACAIDRQRVPGVNTTAIVGSVTGLYDLRGGIGLASLPCHNIPILNTVPSDPKLYFDTQDQRSLNSFNISTWGVNRSGTQEITGKAFTMWKTDSVGNTNVTWTPLEHLLTSMAIREYVYEALKVYFSKMRLTNGDLIVGRSMANASSIKEFIINNYIELSNEALVLGGDDYISSFAETVAVNIDPKSQLVIIYGIYPIVTHVGVIHAIIQPTLDYGRVVV